MELLTPVSPGELLDKITILEIKSERIADAAKLVNVRRELEALHAIAGRLPPDPDLTRLKADLKAVNETLWAIEDDIRACESAQRFDAGFIRLARAVYQTNDRRSAVKRAINDRLGSTLREEKSYAPY